MKCVLPELPFHLFWIKSHFPIFCIGPTVPKQSRHRPAPPTPQAQAGPRRAPCGAPGPAEPCSQQEPRPGPGNGGNQPTSNARTDPWTPLSPGLPSHSGTETEGFLLPLTLRLRGSCPQSWGAGVQNHTAEHLPAAQWRIIIKACC